MRRGVRAAVEAEAAEIIPAQPFDRSTCHASDDRGMKIVRWSGCMWHQTCVFAYTLQVVPLNGGPPSTFTIPSFQLFYTHVINTFETPESIIFDLVVYDKNMFQYVMSLDEYRDAAIRNVQGRSLLGTVRRVQLLTSGSRRGDVLMTPISSSSVSTDFPNINKRFSGRPHCVYYAVEWFHDGISYGSMAIVKQNLCASTTTTTTATATNPVLQVQAPVYWYKPGYFPSEPTFVSAPLNTFSSVGAEDDGVIMFTVMHGATQESALVIVNATTMSTISWSNVPTTMTFTTHGQFYSGISSAHN
jgi:carotenoid cleavage dioxygenase-like enzyme